MNNEPTWNMGCGHFDAYGDSSHDCSSWGADGATYCNHMTYPETLESPAEYCDEPTVEGSDFCDRHLDDHDE